MKYKEGQSIYEYFTGRTVGIFLVKGWNKKKKKFELSLGGRDKKHFTTLEQLMNNLEHYSKTQHKRVMKLFPEYLI